MQYRVSPDGKQAERYVLQVSGDMPPWFCTSGPSDCIKSRVRLILGRVGFVRYSTLRCQKRELVCCIVGKDALRRLPSVCTSLCEIDDS